MATTVTKSVPFSANVDAALTEFLDHSYEDLAYRDHILMGLCAKKARYGDAVKVPMKYAYSSGIGGTFSTAQTNATNTKRKGFLVPPVVPGLYGIEDVPETDILYSENKEAAVIDMLTDAVKGCHESASDQLEAALFASGFGELGTISSSTNPGSGTTFVLVLTLPSDTEHFFDGQILVTKATAATGSLDTGTFKVTSVDLQAGTITGTAQSSWTPTNGHVLGVQGTMLASTATSTFIGLAGWIPLTAPANDGTDSFFGVDRGANITALAGHRLPVSGKPIVTVVKNLAVQIARFGRAKPDVCLMSWNQYGKVLDLIDAKQYYVQTKGDGITIFYDGVWVQGPKGRIAIHPSTFCPDDRLYVLDSSTWHLDAPNNRIVQPANGSGKPIEMSNLDAREVRARASGFFYCSGPGYNGVAALPATF